MNLLAEPVLGLLGPLQPLLANPAVTAVVVHAGGVHVVQAGQRLRHPERLEPDAWTALLKTLRESLPGGGSVRRAPLEGGGWLTLVELPGSPALLSVDKRAVVPAPLDALVDDGLRRTLPALVGAGVALLVVSRSTRARHATLDAVLRMLPEDANLLVIQPDDVPDLGPASALRLVPAGEDRAWEYALRALDPEWLGLPEAHRGGMAALRVAGQVGAVLASCPGVDAESALGLLGSAAEGASRLAAGVFRAVLEVEPAGTQVVAVALREVTRLGEGRVALGTLWARAPGEPRGTWKDVPSFAGRLGLEGPLPWQELMAAAPSLALGSLFGGVEPPLPAPRPAFESSVPTSPALPASPPVPLSASPGAPTMPPGEVPETPAPEPPSPIVVRADGAARPAPAEPPPPPAPAVEPPLPDPVPQALPASPGDALFGDDEVTASAPGSRTPPPPPPEPAAEEPEPPPPPEPFGESAGDSPFPPEDPPPPEEDPPLPEPPPPPADAADADAPSEDNRTDERRIPGRAEIGDEAEDPETTPLPASMPVGVAVQDPEPPPEEDAPPAPEAPPTDAAPSPRRSLPPPLPPGALADAPPRPGPRLAPSREPLRATIPPRPTAHAKAPGRPEPHPGTNPFAEVLKRAGEPGRRDTAAARPRAAEIHPVTSTLPRAGAVRAPATSTRVAPLPGSRPLPPPPPPPDPEDGFDSNSGVFAPGPRKPEGKG